MFKNIAILWGAEICSQVDMHWHWRGICCLHHHGGSWWLRQHFLWSLSKYVPNHMASHSRRQSSSGYDNENGAWFIIAWTAVVWIWWWEFIL